MKEKKRLDWWCHRAWIKFSVGITMVVMLMILINWKNWSTELKFIASIAALIPIHVIEEWVFPGGCHYQYNVGLFRSEYPNCYPMCRLSDMFTNLIGTLFFLILTIIFATHGAVPNGVVMGSIIFCGMELFVHTVIGIIMHLKFKSKGKTTIYGPGSITTYFGFVPLGVIGWYSIQGKEMVGTDWLMCVGVLIFILFGCILIPENVIKKKNSPYEFETAGYYERFLD